MRKEEFCEILGEISEKHIVEARMFQRNKKSAWLKWGAIAACFVLLISCIVTAGHISIHVNDEVSPAETLSDNTDPSKTLQNETNSTEISENETDSIEPSPNDDKQTVDQINGSAEMTTAPDNQIISSELQNRIDELSSADSLGWIVYNGSIYMQNWQIDFATLNKEKDNIELSESLGYAGDFIGYYKKSADRDVYVPNGVVYMVTDNPDILCIKLDNGGTVWLGIVK